MAIHITEDCIVCGACEAECPNGAIREAGGTYCIEPELCCECVGFHDEPACQAVCPVECCVPDPDHEETEAELAARAVRIHPDDAELRARVDSDKLPSRFRRA